MGINDFLNLANLQIGWYDRVEINYKTDRRAGFKRCYYPLTGSKCSVITARRLVGETLLESRRKNDIYILNFGRHNFRYKDYPKEIKKTRLNRNDSVFGLINI